MKKKGQGGGLVTGLVFGIAGLVIGVIIAFIVVSTLLNAGLLGGGSTTGTVTNESGAATANAIVFVNQTGYALVSANATTRSYTITAVWSEDSTEYNLTVPAVNYSISTAGVLKNATIKTQANVSVSYTFVAKAEEELATDRMSANFTEGVDNVSVQLPTVLLIAAIVLILGVLAILVGVWQRMRMGGGQL